MNDDASQPLPEPTKPDGRDGFRTIRVTDAVYDRLQALRTKISEVGALALHAALRQRLVSILSTPTPSGRPASLTLSVVLDLAMEAFDVLDNVTDGGDEA